MTGGWNVAHADDYNKLLLSPTAGSPTTWLDRNLQSTWAFANLQQLNQVSMSVSGTLCGWYLVISTICFWTTQQRNFFPAHINHWQHRQTICGKKGWSQTWPTAIVNFSTNYKSSRVKFSSFSSHLNTKSNTNISKKYFLSKRKWRPCTYQRGGKFSH